MVKIRTHVFISGRVQGVFFRANTKRRAKKLDVRGWVKNLPDGRVEAVLAGEEKKVKKLINWLHQGPPRARVKNLKVEKDPSHNQFSSFEIKR